MSTINSRRLPGRPWHPRNSADVEPGADQALHWECGVRSAKPRTGVHEVNSQAAGEPRNGSSGHPPSPKTQP